MSARRDDPPCDWPDCPTHHPRAATPPADPDRAVGLGIFGGREDRSQDPTSAISEADLFWGYRNRGGPEPDG